MRRALIVIVFILAGGGLLLAQRWRYGPRWGEGWTPEFETCRTAREVPSHSTGTPNWTNEPSFEKDVFTFVRVRRDSNSRRGGPWSTDFPDSDLNLSFRLQQVTSLKVDPDARVLRLSDSDLFDYPWIYMVEPGSLELREAEVTALRKYLLNGGVVMADDFWGRYQWGNFEEQIKRVLPGRQFEELPMSHQIFHCVFDLKGPICNLQTPNIRQGVRSRYDHITWEFHDGEECRDMRVKVINDDQGRIMVLAVHNCDNGDGWEREGEDDFFFHEFSEKRAYPLGVNILFYLMTH